MTSDKKKTATKGKKKKTVFWKILLAVLFLLILTGGYASYKVYTMLYKPNVLTESNKKTYVYIPTGSNFEDVKEILYNKNLVRNKSSFEWLAERKNYINHIMPGRYLVRTGMSNNELINMLRSGQQEPVQLTFNNIRTKEQLAGKIGSQIECDSILILELLKNKNKVSEYGFNTETVLCMFIPDTYEMYWNTDGEKFLEKMSKAYKLFWNDARKKKAVSLGLTQSQVSILASIVEKETSKKDEMQTIAGVYYNRLQKGMLLQADPTVVFAIGDFSIKRLLYKHLDYDSPYNTYKNAGLPPGPICIPSPSTIDKVLNLERHKYYYFCAKEDFSGYHNFASTLEQHNQYARKYQSALNRRKIR